MRAVQFLTILVLAGTFTTTALAQVRFQPPRSTPVRSSPIRFTRPQWTPSRFTATTTPVQRFSQVRFTPQRFAPLRNPQIRFQPEQFQLPRMSGTHHTSAPQAAPSRSTVSPAQSSRAARTSLDRFSKGVDSLNTR